MKKHVKQLIAHPLISGSSIIFIGSFLMSIGNYIYNLLMGRMLSVEDYGLLISLLSLFILFGIFSNAFTNVFVKFSAQYKSSENHAGMAELFSYGTRVLSVAALALVVVYLMLMPFLRDMLQVDNVLYLLLILAAIIASLFLTLPLGILQGRMQFVSLSFANVSQPIIKIIAVLAFFSLGLSILSPFIAIVVSVLIPGIVLYWFLGSKYKKNKDEKTPDTSIFRKEFFSYSYTYFLTGAGIALLSNTDILLVRYFFDEASSGQYAALSLMGKAIFYLVTPINYAFFPLIAYKRERKEKLFGTVLLTFSLVSIASLTLSFIYFTFPSLILTIFFPSPDFAPVGKYLGLFSLYIFVFILASLLSSFFLSIGKTGVYKISLFAAGVQILLLFYFHNSLYQVIGSLFAASLLFFLILLVYYVKHGSD